MLSKKKITLFIISILIALPQFVKAQRVKAKNEVSVSSSGESGSVANEAKEKAVADHYTQLEMKANVAFTIGKFDEAKYYYQKALVLQPGAEWPAWQLSKIEAQKLAAASKQYQRLCDLCYTKYKITADSAFAKKAYGVAKSAYTNALGYKSDRHVVSQLVKIEKLEKEERYQQLMQAGKAALASSSLDEAASAYAEALRMGINDREAKKAMAELAARRADLIKKEEATIKNVAKRTAYSDTLRIADLHFRNASYEAARKLYKKAELLNPGESYSRRKIAEIDSILIAGKRVQERLQKENANAALYEATISKADKAFKLGDHKAAKSFYESAQRLRPGDKHAVQRIAAIEVVMFEARGRSKTALKKEMNEVSENGRYNQLLKEADAAFAAKQYEKARDHFLAALAINPAATAPRAQVHLINRKLEEQRNELRYKYFIRLADSTAFHANDLPEAISYYDSAHTLKPQEIYAKTQIVLIKDQLLRTAARSGGGEKQKARSEKFNEAFKVYRKADEARIEKKFGEAYTGFSTFLDYVHTDNINLYQIGELYYINQAKDYLQQLDSYKPPRLESAKEMTAEDKRRRSNVKTNR